MCDTKNLKFTDRHFSSYLLSIPMLKGIVSALFVDCLTCMAIRLFYNYNCLHVRTRRSEPPDMAPPR